MFENMTPWMTAAIILLAIFANSRLRRFRRGRFGKGKRARFSAKRPSKEIFPKSLLRLKEPLIEITAFVIVLAAVGASVIAGLYPLAFYLLCATLAIWLRRLRKTKIRRDLARSLQAFNPGVAGEAAVSQEIRRLGYDVIDDVYLPIGSGYTQIDHIAAIGSLIVTVETKRWKGIVEGDWDDQTWLVRGTKTFHVNNPRRQNAVHEAALRKATSTEIRGTRINAATTIRPHGWPEDEIVRLSELESLFAKWTRQRPSTIPSRWRWRRLVKLIEKIDRTEARASHEAMVYRAKLRSS